MLNIPFCAYFVQISTTFLLSATEAFSVLSSLMFALMNSTGAVGAGRHRLGRRAGEPVDHRAARYQAEEERRVHQRQLLDVGRQPRRQQEDDREDHRRRADHRRADQHRLRRRLEGVAGAVVLLEQILGAIEPDVEPVVALQLLLDARRSPR
jgi:hypothetical protein